MDCIQNSTCTHGHSCLGLFRSVRNLIFLYNTGAYVYAITDMNQRALISVHFHPAGLINLELLTLWKISECLGIHIVVDNFFFLSRLNIFYHTIIPSQLKILKHPTSSHSPRFERVQTVVQIDPSGNRIESVGLGYHRNMEH